LLKEGQPDERAAVAAIDALLVAADAARTATAGTRTPMRASVRFMAPTYGAPRLGESGENPTLRRLVPLALEEKDAKAT
jgi:hypothetical protein